MILVEILNVFKEKYLPRTVVNKIIQTKCTYYSFEMNKGSGRHDFSFSETNPFSFSD